MGKSINKTTVTTSVFTIGIILSFLSHYFPETKILIWILLAISLIYLSIGWYLFRAYHPEEHPVLLFFIGYFYAGVFIGSVFAASERPLTQTMMMASVFWAVAQMVVIIIIRKKMPRKGFIQFLIEASLMLLMAVWQIIRY